MYKYVQKSQGLLAQTLGYSGTTFLQELPMTRQYQELMGTGTCSTEPNLLLGLSVSLQFPQAKSCVARGTGL